MVAMETVADLLPRSTASMFEQYLA